MNSLRIFNFASSLAKTLEEKYKNLVVTYKVNDKIDGVADNKYPYVIFHLNVEDKGGMVLFAVSLKESNSNRYQVGLLNNNSEKVLRELNNKVNKAFFFNITGWDEQKGAKSIYDFGDKRITMQDKWEMHLTSDPLIVDGIEINEIVESVNRYFEMKNIQLLLGGETIHLDGIDIRLAKYKHLLPAEFETRLDIAKYTIDNWFNAKYLFMVKLFIEAYQQIVTEHDITQSDASTVLILNKLYKEMEDEYFSVIEAFTRKYGVVRPQRLNTLIQWVM